MLGIHYDIGYLREKSKQKIKAELKWLPRNMWSTSTIVAYLNSFMILTVFVFSSSLSLFTFPPPRVPIPRLPPDVVSAACEAESTITVGKAMELIGALPISAASTFAVALSAIFEQVFCPVIMESTAMFGVYTKKSARIVYDGKYSTHC